MSKKQVFMLACVFVFSFTARINALILKGPYLIYSGPNTEMNVLWQMDSKSNCEIRWGLDQTYSTGRAQTSEYAKDHQHKIKITELQPGGKYYYQVSEGGHSYNGCFLAAPYSNATSLQFFAYGDTRSNPARQNEVCGGVITAFSQDPACQTFMLHVGDWVNGNSDKVWANEFFARAYKNNIAMQADLPIAGCRGNHETRGSGKTFIEYWPYPYTGAGLYWSFDYGPAHIAILDEYSNYKKGSAQLEWLTKDLRNSAKKWKFIVLHEPGWSAGSIRGNNEDVQSNIQPLCELYGVQIVFGGHNHYYSRAEVNGIQHLTLGTGGAPFHTPKLWKATNLVVVKTQILGFCKISISGNTLYYQMLSTPDNRVIDTFTIQQ